MPLPPGGLRVYPGRELLRGEAREGQEKVGHIPLGVQDQDGDALQEHFFQQDGAQAGLAGPGHPQDDGVGGEVARGIEDRSVGNGAGRQVVFTAQVEIAGHGTSYLSE
jgi:hypothetical protein